MRTGLLSMVLPVLALTACAPLPVSGTDAPPGDSARGDSAPYGTDAATWPSTDAAPYYPRHDPASPPPESPIHFPRVSCENVDPAGGDWCPLPRSFCVDEHWLAYYTEPSCAAGWCAWNTLFMYCAIGCSFDGCFSPGT